MAKSLITADTVVKRQRVKKIARSQGHRIDLAELVAETYAKFPNDMARLAE
jgi:hypothetical protein